MSEVHSDQQEMEELYPNERAFLVAEARKLQAGLELKYFDDLHEAHQIAKQCVEALDSLVIEAGVVGAPVRLIGDEISYFNVRPNLESGWPDLIATHHTLSSDDPTATTPSLDAAFFGFVYSIKGTEHYDGTTEYYPRICYQVRYTDNVTQANVVGVFCAAGSVTNTEIEFLVDRQDADAATAIETLAAVENPVMAELLEQLDYLLPSDGFDKVPLRKAVRFIRKYLDAYGEELTSVQRDAFLDLIKARLRLYNKEKFYVMAKSALAATEVDGGFPVVGQVNGSITVEEVSYARYYYLSGSDVTIRDERHAICITASLKTAAGGTDLYNIPLEKIDILAPSR